MFEQDTIKHHIELSIIRYLMIHEFARFSEMRPKRVDTNLFSYHLKLLLKQGYVTKSDRGYTLSRKGLIYVDRVNLEKMKLRTQPKIITMLLVQDGYGKVLVQKRTKQPHINTLTLPYGKLHISDFSVIEAARREASEKLEFDPHKLRHVGDCYITVLEPQKATGDARSAGVLSDGDVITLAEDIFDTVESRTLVHVVRFETDAIPATDTLQWVEPLDLGTLPLAPAVEQIVTRSFFGDAFFFEDFIVRQ
jgi:8-oxo-dGTP pyrophosphatase MutT (NUDIX family)